MAHIVIVAGFTPSLINFRGPLLRDLIARGYRVSACGPEAPEDIVRKLNDLGIEFYQYPLDRTGLNPLRDLRSFYALFRLFRQLRPDIVLGYTIKPVIFGSLAARCAGVSAYCSMITGLGYSFSQQSGRRSLLSTLVCRLYRFALGKNKVVFFQNPDDLDFFQSLKLVSKRQKTVVVNGSGIDIDHFSYVVPPDKVSFLLIARYLWDKGMGEYVEAARMIKKKYPDVQFNLVGWTDSNPTAVPQQQIDAWQDEGIINDCGRLDDVRQAIAECAVYVLPSYREGTPRTVLEAMATGRPIITTDAAGCRETVDDGQNGFLVPVKSVSELAGAMERFLTTPQLVKQMGEKSREKVIEKYDVQKVNRAIIQSLEKTCSVGE